VDNRSIVLDEPGLSGLTSTHTMITGSIITLIIATATAGLITAALGSGGKLQ
jgi:hypothetical protein